MDGLPREIEDALERLFDGALDQPGRAALDRAAAADPELRGEISWFETVSPVLERMGDTLVAEAPEIDVRASVLAAIRSEKPLPAAEVVPFAPTKRASGARWPVAGLAAAAALAVMTGLWVLSEETSQKISPSPDTQIARTPDAGVTQPGGGTTQAPGDSEASATVPTGEIVATAPQPMDAFPAGQTVERLATLNRQSVLENFRNAHSGDDALKRLVEWAILRADEAESLAAEQGVPAEAVAVASDSLGPEEAARNLRTVVGRKPNDFYVRLQLARALGRGIDRGVEGAAVEQGEQLAALKTQDADNALYDYMDAVRRLEMNPPDVKGALDAIAQAEQLSSASAHSLEAARAREMALSALGADPETAHLLSAFTAGAFEYEQLIDLASRLLTAGQTYEQAGDTETAASLYEAALTMGQQLDAGADVTQEQLAAFDIQQSALEYLAPLADLLGQATQLEQITSDLVGGILNLRSYIEEVNTQIFDNIDDAVMNFVADVIFQQGDMNLFDALRPQN